MKTSTNRLTMAFLFVMAIAMLPFAANSQTVITIQVSPNVLNLQSGGTVVTVHTDIAYGAVAAASVTINGVPISWWKSDNQGNFVAKFNIEDIKSLPLNIGQLNTLTLLGTTKTGTTFTGSYDVMVINVIPSGGGKSK
jgi:ABC-type sulfate transport system permease component